MAFSYASWLQQARRRMGAEANMLQYLETLQEAAERARRPVAANVPFFIDFRLLQSEPDCF